MRGPALLLLLLSVGCGPAEPEDPAAEAEAEAEVEEERFALEADSYRFCHEPGFQGSAAREWCELAEGLPEDRCPGFQAACADETLDVAPFMGCGGGGGGSPGDQAAEAPRAPEDRDLGFDLPSLGCAELSPGAATILKWMVAAGVALGLLLLARVLMSALGRGAPPIEVREVSVVAPPEEDPDIPDRPSGDLLDEAQQALARGQLGEALLLTRGAALRTLHERGHLQVHRARTDREYARAVRRDPALHEPLREVLAEVESFRFGGVAPEVSRVERALDAARRLITGASVFLCFLALSSPAQAQGLASYARYGPDGDAALRELLVQHGYEVRWVAGSLSTLGDETDLLILDLAGFWPSSSDWTDLRAWVDGGGVLVVGGDPRGELEELGSYRRVEDPTLLVWFDEGAARPIPRFPGGIHGMYTEGSGEPWMGVVLPEEDEHDLGWAVVEVRVGEGAILAISDRRVFDNAFLIGTENEAFLPDLLRRGQESSGWEFGEPAQVRLATRTAGEGAFQDPHRAARRMWPFMMQLLLTWGLLVLWKGWPFEVLRDPPREGRVRFSDHVDALAAHYQRLGEEDHAAGAVARLWLGRRGASGLLHAARRAGYSASEAENLVQHVEAVAQGRGGDLELVEELWRVTRGK